MSMTMRASPLRRSGLVTAAIMLPPALVIFTIFVILPIGEAAWYSIFNWDGFGSPTRFIGLDNYGQLFGNSAFGRALINNLLIIVVSLGVQLPLALGMALFLSRRQIGTVTFRLIFFLPYILADVAAGLIWRFVFDGNYGLVSGVSQSLGWGQYFLLTDRNWAFAGVLVVILWKYFGFHMMLYIAGIQSIDRDLYEAAEIDGATTWQRFRYVTLPQLAPMIRLSVFFSVIGSLQLFDMIVPLTGGGPFNSTNTLVSFLYYFGITRMRVGFGSAAGVVLFIICVSFAFGYRRLFMRHD
ncbi:MAG TPA: sugar ABC transporter permease [Magnetospirillaceae bacterium]